MVDLDYLLDLTLSTPGMHLASSSALDTPASRESASLSIRFRNPVPAGPSIWNTGYKPDVYVPLPAAAESFPAGGRAGFLRWLKSRCVLSMSDAVEQHHGQAEIWRKFARCFEVLGTMIHYVCLSTAYLAKRTQTLIVW